MSDQYRGGVFGLIGDLADETKRFADARWPYPIERHARAALGAPVNEGPVAPVLETSARGIGRAVLDDGMDEAEEQDRAELAGLRAQVEELARAVDRLSRT